MLSDLSCTRYVCRAVNLNAMNQRLLSRTSVNSPPHSQPIRLVRRLDCHRELDRELDSGHAAKTRGFLR